MLLGDPFHFTFACCFTRTQAAPRNEAEPELKQHALLQLILLFSLNLPSSAKANGISTKPHCVLLQSPFRFTFACCFSPILKQNPSGSGMAIESYDLRIRFKV